MSLQGHGKGNQESRDKSRDRGDLKRYFRSRSECVRVQVGGCRVGMEIVSRFQRVRSDYEGDVNDYGQTEKYSKTHDGEDRRE